MDFSQLYLICSVFSLNSPILSGIILVYFNGSASVDRYDTINDVVALSFVLAR